MADQPAPDQPAITADRFDGVLFDLDGVLTDTAALHAQAWKAMFDEFLQRWSEANDLPYEPFEIATDYRNHVDGRPRYEGVSAFLESRRIVLPRGQIDDPPTADTTFGLGNRKNDMLHRLIAEGVDPYPASVTLLDRLLADGIACAVVSSSRNARRVLEAAGLIDRFEVIVDGVVAADNQLPGKPAPDTFLEGARRIGTDPARTVVIEDAVAGVEAGRGGGFGLVIGVDRLGQAEALRRKGADIVVGDLGELLEDA